MRQILKLIVSKEKRLLGESLPKMHLVLDVLVDRQMGGCLRFIALYQEVHADRVKNGEVVEELYKSHCSANMSTTKKQKITYGSNITLVWEDLTDLI